MNSVAISSGVSPVALNAEHIQQSFGSAVVWISDRIVKGWLRSIRRRGDAMPMAGEERDDHTRVGGNQVSKELNSDVTPSCANSLLHSLVLAEADETGTVERPLPQCTRSLVLPNWPPRRLQGPVATVVQLIE
jgi:hypothetical protein